MAHSGDGPLAVHLRRGGTSVVLRLDPRHLPCVLHWGPDLGEVPEQGLGELVRALGMPCVDSIVMTQEAVAILPQHSSGWTGRPGLLGSRGGRAWSVAFDDGGALRRGGGHHAVAGRSAGGGAPAQRGFGPTGSAGGHHRGRGPGQRAWSACGRAVRNLGAEVYEVAHLEPALPVPAEAGELLDMAGRHTHERTPQRRPFDMGQWVRESWGGRPGHDSATVLCAGRPGFGFRTGRVWGVHLALQRQPGPLRGALLHGLATAARRRARCCPGEVRLAPGEEYTSPWLFGSWGEGLDEFSGRFHRLPAGPAAAPDAPAPGAAQHLGGRLLRPRPGHAARPGGARRRSSGSSGTCSTTAGSGTAATITRASATGTSTRSVWPDGLHPLVDRVHELGMEFGLWFEPEMVNLDSDLARAHPEWIFRTDHGPGIASRHQHVLDLGPPRGVRVRAGADVRRSSPSTTSPTSSGTTTAPWSTPGTHPDGTPGRARADRGRLPVDGRAQGPPPGPGDRVLLRRRRAGRPRDHRAHRPGLGLGLHRRPRAPADGALDRPDPAAGADGHPRRLGRRPHDQAVARA